MSGPRITSGEGSKHRDAIIIASAYRFWSKVDKTADGCWPWTGSVVEGYGRFYAGGGRANPVSDYAHRIALFLVTGKWGVLGMHACDNRRCCKVGKKHLGWATHRDNSQDALVKGREYVGEANSNSVLSETNVATIFAMRDRGALQREIAVAVGCTLGNVSAVLRRKSWKHVRT